MFKVPHNCRVRTGPWASTDEIGNNGVFIIPYETGMFYTIASDQMGWDHVSVHKKDMLGNLMTPDWNDMCYLKDVFWGEDDCVVQYHPKDKDYVNIHSNVLHLWKCQTQEFPMPPKIMV